MAIAVDLRQSGTSSAGASTLSWSHTVGGGANMILQVNSAEASVSNVSVSGVNWDDGGTPAALALKGRQNDGPAQAWAEIWYLLVPIAGTKTIKVTYTGSVAACTGSASYSGVDQATPYNAASPQGATLSADPVTVDITSAIGELVTDCMVDNENTTDTLVIGAGQTVVHNITVGNNMAGASSDEPGAATVTMSWTGITLNAPWAIIGVSLRPASSVGGGSITPLAMRGPFVRMFAKFPRWQLLNVLSQPVPAFDASLMAAMDRPWRDIAFDLPSVAASGMAPPDLVNP